MIPRCVLAASTIVCMMPIPREIVEGCIVVEVLHVQAHGPCLVIRVRGVRIQIILRAVLNALKELQLLNRHSNSDP